MGNSFEFGRQPQAWDMDPHAESLNQINGLFCCVTELLWERKLATKTCGVLNHSVGPAWVEDLLF